MDDERDRPRVAVIGAGHRGRGWTALALSRGWPVSLYDPESSLLQRASHDVGERVRRLTDAGRADPLAAAGALASLHVGRSLLDAVGQASLVLDVMPLDRDPGKLRAQPGAGKGGQQQQQQGETGGGSDHCDGRCPGHETRFRIIL